VRPRKQGQPRKGWKSSARKTLSDGAIYAAVSQSDMSEDERRDLDLAIDQALGLVPVTRPHKD
jgi:hypothetical protein